MIKLRAFIIILATLLFVTGCGKDLPKPEDMYKDDKAGNSVVENSTDIKDEDSTSEIEDDTADEISDTAGSDINIGTEDVSTDYGTLKYLKEIPVNKTKKNKSVAYTVKSIKYANLEVDDYYKDLFENKSNIKCIVVNVKVENTEDKNVGIGIAGSALVLNTKEQASENAYLTDVVLYDEMYGKVEKTGKIIFAINSDFDKIKSAKLVLNSIYDADTSSGDNKKTVFDIKIK